MNKVKFTNKIYYYGVIALLVCDVVFTASKLPNGEVVHFIRLLIVLITMVLAALKISPVKNVIKIWSILFFMLGSGMVLFASLGSILLTEQSFIDRTDRILMGSINLLLGVIIYLGSDRYIYDPSID